MSIIKFHGVLIDNSIKAPQNMGVNEQYWINRVL